MGEHPQKVEPKSELDGRNEQWWACPFYNSACTSTFVRDRLYILVGKGKRASTKVNKTTTRTSWIPMAGFNGAIEFLEEWIIHGVYEYRLRQKRGIPSANAKRTKLDRRPSPIELGDTIWKKLVLHTIYILNMHANKNYNIMLSIHTEPAVIYPNRGSYTFEHQ
jgi:hypothetical protein